MIVELFPVAGVVKDFDLCGELLYFGHDLGIMSEKRIKINNKWVMDRGK